MCPDPSAGSPRLRCPGQWCGYHHYGWNTLPESSHCRPIEEEDPKEAPKEAPKETPKEARPNSPEL